MTYKLNVPYIGQVGLGADEHNNDCGAASEGMTRKYILGSSPTVDALFNAIMPSGDAYLSVGSILNQLSAAGIECDWDANFTDAELWKTLSGGVPVIALINYGALAAIRPNRFTGSHFVVVIGIDLDTVYIHDPLNNVSNGECVEVPLAMWDKCWSTVIDNNPQRSMIIPSNTVKGSTTVVTPGILKTVKARDKDGCRIRSTPDSSIKTNILYSVLQNTVLYIYEIKGSWGRIHATRQEWVCLDYTV